ncbi:CotH kinase family protein [Nocardioides sp. W7]|uniref:CotH kinase family protein n=1 Tax=Nocardioides sp. W7 TaxID=2931390 RepID=UPI001FD44D35|nr:CotH kinase family protein [Nocardioides sp. W7]
MTASLLTPATYAAATPGPTTSAGHAATTERAPASRRLQLRPAVPRAGSSYRVSGRVPATSPRRVVLQVRRDGVWRTRVRGASSRTGAFRLTWRSRTPQRLRVLAPASAGRAGRAPRTRWVSVPVTVRPRAAAPVVPAVTLTAPPSVAEHRQLQVALASAPAAPGRTAVLQREAGGAWAAVATARTDAAGSATFTATGGDAGAGGPGRERYRAVLEAGAGGGPVASAPVEVVLLQGLPRVEISTDDGMLIGDTNGSGGHDEGDDRSQYSHGLLSIDPRGSALPGTVQGSRFRIRGNSTSWIQDKLPYKVKLDQKVSLLGLPKAKDWVLLANFFDRSLLRNNVAFETARRVEMPWAPRLADVELWLNGSYAGVYQLGESIETGPDRVDIDVDPDGADAAAAANGGYLLEADFWDDTNPRFRTAQGAQIYLQEPEFDSVEQAAPYLERVRADVQDFEDALYSAEFADPVSGYRAHVDVRSFIDWYLVNELMKNIDSGYHGSCWLYRDDGGRLAMGPVWDFDFSAGNRTFSDLDEPTGWFLRRNWYPRWGQDAVSMLQGPEGHWLNRMFADPWFVGQVEDRWEQVRTDLLGMPDYLRAQADRLAPAATRNFAPRLQGGAGMQLGQTFLESDGVFHDGWPAYVADLDGWLTRRLAWLDGQLRPAGRR